MADRRRWLAVVPSTRHAARRALLCALVVAMSILACDGAHDTNRSESRLLDEVCGGSNCTVSGSARRTTGPTGDSIGFKAGPDPGSISIPLSTPSGYDQNIVEVLVSGHGNAQIGGVSLALSTEPHWIEAQTAAQSSSSGSPLVASVAVTQGNDVSLYDVRVISYHTINCD